MNNSIFDLFGLDSKSLSKSFEDFNLHDIVKNNKNISGAFDKLTDEEKTRVVDSMNKIQSSFDDWFGTKSVKWTADDFKGANVSVSSYSSEDDKKEEKKEEKKVVKVKTNHPVNEQPESKKEDNTITFDEAECDEEFEDYFDDAEDNDSEMDDCRDCASCDMEDCPDRVCEYEGDGSEDDEDEYAPEDGSICAQLLAELEEEDTADELDVDDIANFVLETLNDKEHKNYKLHPATKGVPAAVEVVIPESIAKSEITQNIHIMTMLHDVLVDTIGAYDAYISPDDKSEGLVVYIPLTKI